MFRSAATIVEEEANRRLRRRTGWAVAALIAFVVAGLIAFSAAWHRFPWSDQPTSYHACGTTYWQTNLDAFSWASSMGNRPVPGSSRAPLRLVGETPGWPNARGIYAYKYSGTRRNDGCGYLTFLRVAGDEYMVYGDAAVEDTIVG